jgi:hypothetical protein
MVDQKLLKMKPTELLKLYGLKGDDEPFVLWGVRIDMSDTPAAMEILKSLHAYAESEMERIQKETPSVQASQVEEPVTEGMASRIRGNMTPAQATALMEHPLVDDDVKAKIEEATAAVKIDRDAIENIVIGESDELSFFQKVRNFFSKLFHRNGNGVEDPFLSSAAIDVIDTFGKETFEPPQAAIQVEARAIIDVIPAEPVSDVPARLDPARRVKPIRAKPTIWTVDGKQKPLEPAIHRNREHDPLGIDTIDDEIRAIIRGEIPCV